MVSSVAPLRIRRFRTLWAASVFSNIGAFLQASAAAWFMLELTGSATWVGLMSASTSLPFLALALVAGAIADMMERTRVLIYAQAVMGSAAAAMAALTFLGHATPERLLGLGLVMGVAGAFNLPAWQALVPDLVPREMVASAVALNSVAFNVARTVGPVLGGLLVATLGAAYGFGLNALSYLLVIGALWAMRRRHPDAPVRDQTPLSTAIALGIRYARYTRPFRRLLLIGALFALTSAVVQTALPSHTEALGGGSLAYGLLLGAMGVGAIAAGFTRRHVVDRMGSRSVPLTMTAFGVAGIGVGLAPGLVWAGAGLVIAGACWLWTLATLNTTAQLLSPAWVRGRTMSLYTLSFVGIYPLGSILAGAVTDAIGTASAYAVLSAAGIALGIATIRAGIPGLDDIVSPEFSEDRTAPVHPEAGGGGPVMILNNWRINPEDAEEFLRAMNELRLVRLRTGAYRWRLYRDASDPLNLTEAFLTTSWEEHLNQHSRIDDSSALLIRQARAFDRRGDPTTQHLVAIDVEEAPDFDDLVLAHEVMHASDGSIPITEAADQTREEQVGRA
ncbi:MAG TPA: MFS transporter [Acidimicrobiia bacterium]|nr:MFS transporter [Acidimicrobiia bacterium]